MAWTSLDLPYFVLDMGSSSSDQKESHRKKVTEKKSQEKSQNKKI